MAGQDWIDPAAVVAVLALPVVAAVAARWRGDGASAASFVTNEGRNGYVATVAGAVAGNVGIGGFFAFYLFTRESPLIGFSLAAAYTIGLLLCAWLAPKMRERARETGTVGLVDLVHDAHGARRMGPVWVPVAIVFVLRSAVQVGALGLIIAEMLRVDHALAVLCCTGLLGAYLVLGGYRAAVETDVAQSIIVAVGVAVAAFGLGALAREPYEPFSLGPHAPALLAGIWLFLPWSAVLAIDNWQRIVVARSGRVARRGYLIAAAICAGIFLVQVLAHLGAPLEGSMSARFGSLMPAGFGWLATMVFVACIMSSVDTFIMPLVASLGAERGVARLRLVIIALLAVTAMTAIAFGDLLTSVIAAFSSLTVFLPAAFGALYLHRPPALAAILSMNAGMVSAVTFTLIDPDSAALVGFVVAAISYAAGLRIGERARSAEG